METKLIPSGILRVYNALFEFIARERIKQQDTDLRQVHAHLISVITTSPLMWGHAIFIVPLMGCSVSLALGIIVSLLHMLSPFIFRWTSNAYLASNVMLTLGTAFVTLVAYNTGGFHSFAVLWYAAGPMLGGMTGGRRGVKTWAMLDLLLCIVYFIFTIYGFPFPNNLSLFGLKLANYFLVFGWLGLSAILSTLFVFLRDSNEQTLQEQGQRIDDLFRVLFHDLANSIGRISIGVLIARKQENSPQTNRGIEITSQAADSMFEITQNVRKMYAVSKGKADMDLSYESLNNAVEYVSKIFATDLEKKNLTLEYAFQKNTGLKLLIEPVSFKNQVLGNIISNAIKFSTPGSQITITAYPINQMYFAVEIRDQGIGMPASILSALFDLNKKTSRPGTQGEAGTGFGMHIMKSFVELYQGQVTVESFETRDSIVSGTTFKIILQGKWN